MKLSEYRDDYYEFSTKLSDLNRQFAFAGIALIWTFRKTGDGGEGIVQDLYFPAVMISIAIAIDLFQYIYQTIIWSGYYSYFYRIKKHPLDYEIKSSIGWNIPAWIAFILKVLFIVTAYYAIIKYLVKTLIV